MSFDYILILIIAVASISFKPGPGMAAIVSRSIEYGFGSAFALSMGAITIELLYFIIAYFGFSIIENHINSFSIILKIVGSAYLFYLAYSSFKKSKPIAASSNSLQVDNNSYFKDYMTGVIVTLSNPLVILFYSALIPTVLDLSSIDMAGLLTALLIIFCVHFVILTAQCALAAQVRTYLQEKVTVQKINLISSFLLAFVALYIVFMLLKSLHLQ